MFVKYFKIKIFKVMRNDFDVFSIVFFNLCRFRFVYKLSFYFYISFVIYVVCCYLDICYL